MNEGYRHGTRLAESRFEFTFDGRVLPAQQGDTAASALIANGLRLVGRSIKYRRARGFLTAGAEEPNGLLTVSRGEHLIPNVPGTQLRLAPGMVVRSQNRWPSLRFDVSTLLRLGAGALSAGFYYKTFMHPSWRFYEPIIRRLAGFGEAPRACALPRSAIRHLSCDVLIAGAGPAGLAAARAAARAGARVVLCERESVYGGELEFESATIEGDAAVRWVAATVAEIQQRHGFVLPETAVLGESGGLTVALTQHGGLPGVDTLYRFDARMLIAATGAVERPIAFVDNDLPGVFLLSAAERYLALHGARVGEKLALFGNHDRLYVAAQRLAAAGQRIGYLIDTRAPQETERTRQQREELQGQGTECLLGHAVTRALGWRGVSGIEIASLSSPESTRTLACDAILMSGGWSPLIHAHPLAGAAQFSEDATAFVAAGNDSYESCGAARGVFELDAVLRTGHELGALLAHRLGFQGLPGEAPAGEGDPAPQLRPFSRSPCKAALEKRQFVDFQNDVTVADLRQAVAEGFQNIEHVKRYTTLGVGTDQGRTSATLGSGIIAEMLGRPVAEVGVFKMRLPYQPFTINSLVGFRSGERLRPTRRTPLHAWHAAHGAVLESMGLWLRPRCYGGGSTGAAKGGRLSEGTMAAFITATGCAEALRVREQGGLFDGSTLGKFEIVGSDAASYLDRMCLSRVSGMPIGRAKYIVTLREDGMVLDDGIAVRLAEDRFLVTASTSHAETMLSHFEFFRDSEMADRKVSVVDVSDGWAVIVCAGPMSRATLGSILGQPWPAQIASLQHMACLIGTYRGSPLRLLRASFSGELAFEAHCRPDVATGLWQDLVDAGMTPYGIEALDILRLEKGYWVGAELNGQTSPFDLGLETLVAQANPCVGHELLKRPALHEPTRHRLVGIRAVDRRAAFMGGAQLIAEGSGEHGKAVRQRALGYITSSAYSPTLKEWIGLALVARDRSSLGTVLIAHDPVRRSSTLIRVSEPVHFDPTGARMKA